MRSFIKRLSDGADRLIAWFVTAVMKLFRMNPDKKLEYIRIVKFTLVGALNTAVDWIAFTLAASVLKIPAVPSQAISYLVGAVNSFFWNKYFTFQANNRITLAECTQFLAVTVAAIGVSSGLVYLLNSLWGWNMYLAKIPATVVSLAVNFIGNRFFVFRKQAEVQNEREMAQK